MRSRRRLLLRLLICAVLVLLALAAAGAWLGYRGLQARDALETARDELASARTLAADQEFVRARSAAGRASDAASRADSLTHDPVWALAARLPWAGRTVGATRTLARSADRLSGEVALPLLDLAPRLDPAVLRKGRSGIDIEPLEAAAGTLRSRLQITEQVRADIAAAPADGVPSAVSDARRSALSSTDELLELLRSADQIATVLPTALGSDRQRRWLIAVQTPVEARGTGGIVGGVSTIVADRGQVTLEELDTNAALAGVLRLDTGLPADYLTRWAAWRPRELALNATVSPHFPYAAAILSDAWEQRTGDEVDGVFTVDPVVLGDLLKATGPVTLSDGTRLDGRNGTQWVLKDAYAQYSDQDVRDARLTELMDRTIERVQERGDGARALLEALRDGAAKGRVLAAMPGAPRVQEVLSGLSIGGTLPAKDAHAVSVTLNDAGASKLDYYARTAVSYLPGACLPGGLQEARLVLELENEAPASGLPSYVTTRSDVARGSAPKGQRKDYWSVYVPAGSALAGATLDGEAMGMEAGSEDGHPVFSAYLTVDPGQTRTLEVLLRVPARAGVPEVQVQPLVQRPEVRTAAFSCS